nr:uncharacterized protein LOC129449263 [Misgurnus anguillicaudatus]
MKTKYCHDTDYRDSKLDYAKAKYRHDVVYRVSKLKNLYDAYHKNVDARMVKCERSKRVYSSNMQFKKLVCKYSHVKFKSNMGFQTRVREYSKKKYLQNLAFKERVHEYSRKKYLQTKKEQKLIDSSIAHFCQEVSRGPEFVCSVCHRLLFRKQVKECKIECYEKKGEQIAALARRCITLRYVHVCDERCSGNSNVSSAECKLWICPTCHRKILYGQLPAESVANNMHLVDIPYQLKCLNSLEQHLVARNIPFLKLLCLPRGKQQGCHGPVVCVPVNASDICNILPRNEYDDMMVRIKLKRKLTL